MQKKILILIISMLLIMPIFASGEKIINLVKSPSVLSDDVPSWQIGHSWKYDMDFKGELGDAMDFNWNFNDILFTVEDSSGDLYSMSITGEITGQINLFEIQLVSGTLKDTTISGTASVEKSNIGLKDIDVHISGKIVVAGIPIKTFTMDIDVSFSPSYYAVDFPISVGKTWTIPISDVSGTAEISILDNPIIIDDIVGGDRAECVGLETKTVEAGSFNAYQIETNGDVKEIYYAADAGNIIKSSWDEGNTVNIVLKSTTYGTTPGAPNKPNRPQGPTSGTSGNQYTYSSSTTDNEGDQIFYLFDWDDGSDSGWLGPFNSGSTCEASHKWNRQGNYQVRVKAKDTEGHESVWSEPLGVSLPRGRAINNPIFILLKNHPIIFYFLQHFLNY